MKSYSYSVALICTFIVSSLALTGQTQLIDDAILIDKTTGYGVMLSKPSALSSGQTLIFPTAAGAVGQVLSITSVSGTEVTLGWTSVSSGSATTSKRITTDNTFTPASNTEVFSIAADANRAYRITGVIRANRVGNTGSDNLVIKVAGPTNTSFVSLALRCFNCAANTTGVPSYGSSSSTSYTSGAVDPAGNGTANYTAYAYGIDGVVVVGSTSGNVTVTADDGGAGTNNITVLADSYILLTEIE